MSLTLRHSALFVKSYPATFSKAYNPNPADDATEIDVDKVLAWDGNGDSYDVYLGTSTPLDSGDLVSEEQAGMTYDPSGLDEGETYYWRIDSHKSGESDIEGDEWSFTTEGAPGGGNFFLIF